MTKEAYSDLCLRASRCTEWHPYPKEKPKVDGDYNVTVKYSKCTATAYYETENDEWRSDNGFYVSNRCITAWAELPEPYEEGAEE